MASMSIIFHLLVVCCLFSAVVTSGQFFGKNYRVNWGEDKVKLESSGKQLSLILDEFSGSGFQSKNLYMFVRIDMKIKLVPDNSAGTVTTFYLYSTGSQHDEIDFEFLGNETGQPYAVHTNVYSQGEGQREQQFKMWFDPTADFHTYSIDWSYNRIIFLVDEYPIRVFRNMAESVGVPFPTSQPMRVHATLWNADDWATQGGRVKTNWTNAPFVASYREFKIKGCNWSKKKSACAAANSTTIPATNGTSTAPEIMDSSSQAKMNWVRTNYMIYDYCLDKKRFPDGLPPECTEA